MKSFQPWMAQPVHILVLNVSSVQNKFWLHLYNLIIFTAGLCSCYIFVSCLSLSLSLKLIYVLCACGFERHYKNSVYLLTTAALLKYIGANDNKTTFLNWNKSLNRKCCINPETVIGKGEFEWWSPAKREIIHFSGLFISVLQFLNVKKFENRWAKKWSRYSFSPAGCYIQCNLQVSSKLHREPGCQQHVLYSGAAGLYFAYQTGNHCSAVGLHV